MKYGLILAGGSGLRMTNTDIPKQFLLIGGKPIIIHTLKKIIEYDLLDKIIIICKDDYINYLRKILIKNHLFEFVEIVPGGTSRLNSVLNGIKYIEEKYKIKSNDIILAHDSVRMFVSKRIIKENIENAIKYGAATTVYPVEETIVQSNDDNFLYKAFPRNDLYLGQSPQTFNIKKFINNTKKIPVDILNTFTDLSENLFYNNNFVYSVIGEKNNIKITRPIDLIIAKSLFREQNKLNNEIGFTKENEKMETCV